MHGYLVHACVWICRRPMLRLARLLLLLEKLMLLLCLLLLLALNSRSGAVGTEARWSVTLLYVKTHTAAPGEVSGWAACLYHMV